MDKLCFFLNTEVLHNYKTNVARNYNLHTIEIGILLGIDDNGISVSDGHIHQ